MTKLSRQQLIGELAHNGPLPNQQELCKVLARRGFSVTQATLSRDLNELRLVKASDGYVLRNGDAPAEPLPAVSRAVREFVREVRRAQNLLVIKTIPGNAQPGGVAIDAVEWSEIVGNNPRDDTILGIGSYDKNGRP